MSELLSLEVFDEEYVERLKGIAFTTLAMLKQLEQINKLIEENNRVVLQNVVLFRSIQRSGIQAAIINAAMFTDEANNSFSLKELARILEKYSRGFTKNDPEKMKSLSAIVREIKSLNTHNTRVKIKNLRDSHYAHIRKQLIESKGKYRESIKNNDLPLAEIKEYIEHIGALLNKISGLLLDKGTVMGIVGDDVTYAQIKGLEEALLTEDWVRCKSSVEVEQEARKYVEEHIKSKTSSS